MDNTSPMILYKITPPVDYNQWLKRLITPLNETTNQNLMKVSKIQRIRKLCYKTLGTILLRPNVRFLPDYLQSSKHYNDYCYKIKNCLFY